MTAQCAPWVPWKFSWLPDYRPICLRLFFQNVSWAFVLIHPMNVSTKLKVRSFTRSWYNRGYPKEMGSPWICPRSLFSKIFNELQFGCILWMYLHAKLEVRSFTCSWVNRGYPKIGVVPGYAHTRGRKGLGMVMVPFGRALVSSCRSSTATFPLSLRVAELLSLLFSSTPLFPYPISISPNPMFPWE